MDYNLVPPENLRESALIVAAINLFTQNPVKGQILRVFEYHSQGDFDDRWKEVEKIIKERIKGLKLPQTLEDDLSGISRQISLEILEWSKYYGKYYCESAFFNNICWTPQGSIDAEKTAKKLVSYESLSVLKRYEIACIHCFEDMIPDLWKQLGKEASHLKRMKRSRMYDRLAIFWSYYINDRAGEIIKDSSINEYGLNIAIEQGNSVAVRYFWTKLTPEEKEKNREKCIVIAAQKPLTGSGLDKDIRFPKSCYISILCFFLNQISEEQQVKILHNNATKLNYNILKGFLNFPYQHFFKPTAKHALSFLENEDYYYLLSSIADRILINHEIYGELFQYAWQKMPGRESAINAWQIEEAVSQLFELKDYRNAKLVLSSTLTSLREKLIFSDRGEDICYSLAKKDEWDALEDFINLCLVNRYVALRFNTTQKKFHVAYQQMS